MSSAPTEQDRWVKIYPIYIDSTKTVAQGRKLAKESAVPKPTLAELTTAAQKLGLLCLEEPEKAYSRDPVIEVGRIRVQLKLGTAPVNPDIANRTALYKKLAEIIPTLPSRVAQAKKAGGKAKGKK